MQHDVVTSASVRANFMDDLRELLAAHLARDGFGVNATDGVDTLLVKHLNVQRRRIQPRSRRVEWSRELREREPMLSVAHRHALASIETESRAGKDLTPRLSRKVVGEKKKAEFTDKSLCEWDVHHFHLGVEHDADGKIKGTSELLFAMAREDALYLIDVLDHDSFEEQRLFDISSANWPALFARFALPTVAGREGGGNISAAERALARQHGVNALTVGPDGRVYGPIGGGIATDGSSSRVRSEADRILDAVMTRERECRAHADEIAQKIQKLTGKSLEVLDLKLIPVEGGVDVLEQQTQILVKPSP